MICCILVEITYTAGNCVHFELLYHNEHIQRSRKLVEVKTFFLYKYLIKKMEKESPVKHLTFIGPEHTGHFV